MNETLKTIMGRRSIRAYRPEQIPYRQLQDVLEAGKFAPSGMNRQPWHFSVIQDKALLSEINATVKATLVKSGAPQMVERAKDPNFSVFYDAPTLVVVSGDEKVPTAPFDCTLAMGNMFLAAASLGIGSCWIHALGQIITYESFPALLKKIGVPEGFKIYAAGSFGFPAEGWPAPAPRAKGTVNLVK